MSEAAQSNSASFEVCAGNESVPVLGGQQDCSPWTAVFRFGGSHTRHCAPTRLFLYFYCILSICAVLNVAIFLIEDAYHAAKIHDRRSTLDLQQPGAADDSAASHSDSEVSFLSRFFCC